MHLSIQIGQAGDAAGLVGLDTPRLATDGGAPASLLQNFADLLASPGTTPAQTMSKQAVSMAADTTENPTSDSEAASGDADLDLPAEPIGELPAATSGKILPPAADGAGKALPVAADPGLALTLQARILTEIRSDKPGADSTLPADSDIATAKRPAASGRGVVSAATQAASEGVTAPTTSEAAPSTKVEPGVELSTNLTTGAVASTGSPNTNFRQQAHASGSAPVAAAERPAAISAPRHTSANSAASIAAGPIDAATRTTQPLLRPVTPDMPASEGPYVGPDLDPDPALKHAAAQLTDAAKRDAKYVADTLIDTDKTAKPEAGRAATPSQAVTDRAAAIRQMAADMPAASPRTTPGGDATAARPSTPREGRAAPAPLKIDLQVRPNAPAAAAPSSTPPGTSVTTLAAPVVTPETTRQTATATRPQIIAETSLNQHSAASEDGSFPELRRASSERPTLGRLAADTASASQSPAATRTAAPSAAAAAAASEPASPATQPNQTYGAIGMAASHTASPTTANAAADLQRIERPAAFETIVERFAEARQAAQPGRAEISVLHREFGHVAMQFEMAGRQLKVSLASNDADFAPAVQAAMADRPVLAASDAARADSNSSRHDQRQDQRHDLRGEQRQEASQQGSNGSGQSLAHSQTAQHNGTRAQRGNAALDDDRNPAGNDRSDGHDATQGNSHNHGLYA